MHVSGSEENFKQFTALVLKLLKKNIGNLFVRPFVISLLTFRYFSTIVSIFGAGAASFLTAPAPAPAPSKPFRRLRLRLRLRPKCVGSGGSRKVIKTQWLCSVQAANVFKIFTALFY